MPSSASLTARVHGPGGSADGCSRRVSPTWAAPFASVLGIMLAIIETIQACSLHLLLTLCRLLQIGSGAHAGHA